MKTFITAVLCLCAGLCSAQTNTRANNGTFTGNVSVGGTLNGLFYASTASGLQAVITALPSTGGTVFLSPGTFAFGGTCLSIPAGKNGVTIIGAGADSTIISCSANTGDAIAVGSSSADTFRFSLSNVTIDVSGASGAAGGTATGNALHLMRCWWCTTTNVQYKTLNGGTQLTGQTAIFVDGTGRQSVFNLIINPQISTNFTTGIKFANVANNSNQIIGGNLTNGTSAPQAGSTAISFDATAGQNRVYGTDIENWGKGIDSAGQGNHFDVRLEANTNDVTFEAASVAERLMGDALTIVDNGTFNQTELDPIGGFLRGNKLFALQGIGDGTSPPLTVGTTQFWEDVAGNTVAQRNTTTNQTFRVYQTIGGGNNLFLNMSGNCSGGAPGLCVGGSGTFVNSDLILYPLGTGFNKFAGGNAFISSAGLGTFKGLNSTLFQTATNCTSAGGTCVAAPAGAVTIAAAASTVVVATTVVTANSDIILTRNNGLGTRLSVTCNTQSSLVLGTAYVSAISAGVSFTITIDVAPTTNPLCLSYSIMN